MFPAVNFLTSQTTMEHWHVLVIVLLAMLVLMCIIKMLPKFMCSEGFQVEEETHRKIVSAFFDVNGDNPSKEDIDAINDKLNSGEINEEGLKEAVEQLMDSKRTELASDHIKLGDPEWIYGKLGFMTIAVPFTVSFTGTDDNPNVELLVSIDSLGTNLSGAVLDDGSELKKRVAGASSYKLDVPATSSGKITLNQSRKRDVFLRVSAEDEEASRNYESPHKEYPPENSNSNFINVDVAVRAGNEITLPFSIESIGSSLEFRWKAPRKSTVIKDVIAGDGAIPYKHTSPDAIKFNLPESVKEGKVVLQQTLGKHHAVSGWFIASDEVQYFSIAGEDVAEEELPDSKPDTLTRVSDTKSDMVDMDVFPLPDAPVDTKMIKVSPKIVFDIPKATKLNRKSNNYKVEVPFELRFDAGDLHDGNDDLVLTWDLDPATTIFRSIKHGEKETKSPNSMLAMDKFTLNLRPEESPLILVFEQPMGRRPFRVNLAYAGDTTSMMISGLPSEKKSAGMIGVTRPIDFKGQPAPRFTDVHETAEERVKALYTSKGGKPDDQTIKFLMNKYFEWGGDMKRIENLVSTILTMTDGEDEDSDAIRKAIASLEAGTSPGEVKQALKNWREYEMNRAMWRPDESSVGAAGATALNRPWGPVASTLAKPHGTDQPTIPANAVSDFSVAPGYSSEIVGQGHWMF